MFQNPQIHVSELPDVQQLSFTPLAQRYIYVLRIQSAICWILLLGIVWTGKLLLPTIEWLPLWATMLVSLVLMSGLIAHQLLLGKAMAYRGYAVRMHDLSYRRGIIRHKEMSIPYRRVQQVSISQGLIERPLKLYTLTAYNASETDSDLSISGLNQEDAERIKSFVLKNISIEDEQDGF